MKISLRGVFRAAGRGRPSVDDDQKEIPSGTASSAGHVVSHAPTSHVSGTAGDHAGWWRLVKMLLGVVFDSCEERFKHIQENTSLGQNTTCTFSGRPCLSRYNAALKTVKR